MISILVGNLPNVKKQIEKNVVGSAPYITQIATQLFEESIADIYRNYGIGANYQRIQSINKDYFFSRSVTAFFALRRLSSSISA